MIALAAQLAETRWLGEISYCDIACSHLLDFIRSYIHVFQNNWLLNVDTYQQNQNNNEHKKAWQNRNQQERIIKAVQLFATAASAAADFFFLIPRRLTDGYSQRNERL